MFSSVTMWHAQCKFIFFPVFEEIKDFAVQQICRSSICPVSVYSSWPLHIFPFLSLLLSGQCSLEPEGVYRCGMSAWLVPDWGWSHRSMESIFKSNPYFFFIVLDVVEPGQVALCERVCCTSTVTWWDSQNSCSVNHRVRLMGCALGCATIHISLMILWSVIFWKLRWYLVSKAPSQ